MSENYKQVAWGSNHWVKVFSQSSLRLPIETHDRGDSRGYSPRWTARIGRLEVTAASKRAVLEQLGRLVSDAVKSFPREDRVLTLRGPVADFYAAARIDPDRVELQRSLPGERRPTICSVASDSAKSLQDHIVEEFASQFVLTGLFRAMAQIARGRFTHLCPACDQPSDLPVPEPGGGLVECGNPGCRERQPPMNWYRRK